MKKCFSLVMVGVVAACLSSGSAFAGHGHGGVHHSQPSHTVVHVAPAPHSHHHVRPHHHHHHHADTGDFIIATAILISALM